MAYRCLIKRRSCTFLITTKLIMRGPAKLYGRITAVKGLRIRQNFLSESLKRLDQGTHDEELADHGSFAASHDLGLLDRKKGAGSRAPSHCQSRGRFRKSEGRERAGRLALFLCQ